MARGCKVKICERCGGRGHGIEICPTAKKSEALQAIETNGSVVDDKCAVATSAFMATENKGTCNGLIDHVDVAGLAKQVEVEPWILDTHASDHMSPNAKAMVCYREADETVRTADGSTCKIEGHGDILSSCRPGDEDMKKSLIGVVAHIPQLRHHLVSASALAKKGHNFCSRPGGLLNNLKSSKSIMLPLVGKLYTVYARRLQ